MLRTPNSLHCLTCAALSTRGRATPSGKKRRTWSSIAASDIVVMSKHIPFRIRQAVRAEPRHYLIVSAIVSCDGCPSCLFRRLPARAWFDVLFYSRSWGGAGPPDGGAQAKMGGREMPELPVLRRHTIYEGAPAERMSCVVGDLDQDGVPEFIISTCNPDQLHWFGRTSSGAWEPHLIGDTFPSISVGGALVDLTVNGRLELIAGTSDRGSWAARAAQTGGGRREPVGSRGVARPAARRAHAAGGRLRW